MHAGITCTGKCSKNCRSDARKHRVDNDHNNQDVLADYSRNVGTFFHEVAHVKPADKGDET
jgi:hypothetical protein